MSLRDGIIYTPTYFSKGFSIVSKTLSPGLQERYTDTTYYLHRRLNRSYKARMSTFFGMACTCILFIVQMPYIYKQNKHTHSTQLCFIFCLFDVMQTVNVTQERYYPTITNYIILVVGIYYKKVTPPTYVTDCAQVPFLLHPSNTLLLSHFVRVIIVTVHPIVVGCNRTLLTHTYYGEWENMSVTLHQKKNVCQGYVTSDTVSTGDAITWECTCYGQQC